MATRWLISVDELWDAIGSRDLSIVDCRFVLADPGAGRRAYREAHIPGALYAHLDEDLSAAVGTGTGRHPLPEPERFAATLGAWGIGRETRVVAYDDAAGAIAARLWWLLGWIGHEHRLLLDGGLAAWRRAGLPETTELPRPAPRRFRPRPAWDRVVDTEEAARRLLGRPGLVDARDERRFAGLEEPIDPVAGHIPGAINHPYVRNLDEQGRFLAPEELKRRLEPLSAAIPEGPVMMCGSGVTACHNALAMAVAGLPEPRVYVGSWSAWVSDPARPVAAGPAEL